MHERLRTVVLPVGLALGLTLGLTVGTPSATAAPVERAPARPAQPAGVPETLASSVAASNRVVDPSFPVDFVAVTWTGEHGKASVRFRHGTTWTAWQDMTEDGIEEPGKFASGLSPAGDADAYQVRIPAGVRSAPELAGVTVLIVDDDVRNVFALTSALELHGMTVLYADNGADGIRLLAQHPEVDIVLMDALMPALDGNETTRLIRTLPQGESLPVVFLTAKAMPGDRESSLAAGASDYITKPVDLDELLTVMASWVSRARQQQDGARLST